MMLRRLLLPILLLTTSVAMAQKTYTIAFYNSENLYDTINDPDVDDEEFLPAGKNKWTGDRYEKKLNNLSRVIDSLGGGPSLLGMCEIENKAVLEDLIKTKRLVGKGYGIVHHSSPDKRGIDVAMIYKTADFEPIYQKGLKVELSDGYPTRDVLLVKGKLAGKEMYVFVNHWPSRRGGEEESKPKRMAAAKVARTSIDSILAKNPNAAIVLMGDFNDTPKDASITEGLQANGDPKKGQLFNSSLALAEKGEGTHSYKEEWSLLDQLIISTGLKTGKSSIQWVENSTSIYRPVWMHDKYSKHAGAPYRTFVGPKFIGGYSDHFPVFLQVEVK